MISLWCALAIAGPPLPSVTDPMAPPPEPEPEPTATAPEDPAALPDKPGGPDDPDDVAVPEPQPKTKTKDGDEGTPVAAAPAKKAGPAPAPHPDAVARQSSVQLKKRKKDKFGRPGSPQRFEFEFKIGPYLPDVDRTYDGPGFGPYATIFGRTNDQGITDKKPLPGVMPAIAFEWQFYYLAGPLGLGFQAAFFRDKAKAVLADGPDDNGNIRSSADSTTFSMVPLAVLVGYRFELLADRYKVPLVPYARAGPAYSFWWSRDGNGKIAENSSGAKGRGGVWGWQLNTGLMLRLDFIERGTAKKLDNASGINHTYLFAEFQLSRLNNFGVGNAIALGDATGFGGLAIEF